MKRSAIVPFALALASLHLPLSAQPLSKASVADIEQQLAPTAPVARSLNGTRNLVPVVRSIDLVIQFDSGKASLQDKSKPLLDNLAQAMKGERLKEVRFKIEGHTDAQGSANLNDKLSLERAQTVVQFLQQKQIAPDRLMAEGKGFRELLVPDRPQAMENRRVRITTLNSDDAQTAYLVSPAEMQASNSAPLRLSAKAVPVKDAPAIQVTAPVLPGPVKSPTPITVKFLPTAPSNIKPDSFRVLYGSFEIDITKRLLNVAKVTEQGVQVSEAALPSGKHKLLLEVEDTAGRKASRLVEFEVN
jgi:outer membrane protein OmpA-like peptidoglycan-associated protein